MKYSTKTLTPEYIICGGTSRVEYPTWKDYETFEEAVKEAKKTAAKLKKDVEVWAVKATVKFPEPAFEVVMETDKEAKS